MTCFPDTICGTVCLFAVKIKQRRALAAAVVSSPTNPLCVCLLQLLGLNSLAHTKKCLDRLADQVWLGLIIFAAVWVYRVCLLTTSFVGQQTRCCGAMADRNNEAFECVKVNSGRLSRSSEEREATSGRRKGLQFILLTFTQTWVYGTQQGHLASYTDSHTATVIPWVL